MPDLVARLSGLHTTITTRLSLQESLLSLSGRLDMVLSQIEMRSSVAPTPLAPRGAGKRTLVESENATRYVEGESEEEEEEDKMEVEVERNSGDEAGSVEDVELGDESSSEESEESEDDSDSGGSDGEEPTVNGFIDDEADEYTDEDESGEEEEDEDESE